jgi:hypothetical protein
MLEKTRLLRRFQRLAMTALSIQMNLYDHCISNQLLGVLMWNAGVNFFDLSQDRFVVGDYRLGSAASFLTLYNHFHGCAAL